MGGCIGPNGCAVLYRTSSNPKRATRNRICITTHRPPFLFERAIAWTSDSKEAFNQAGEKSHGKELAGYTAAKAVSIDSKLVLVTTRYLPIYLPIYLLKELKDLTSRNIGKISSKSSRRPKWGLKERHTPPRAARRGWRAHFAARNGILRCWGPPH